MSARILVVDDILANRRLMQAKLEAKYYSVLLAENGPHALEVAHSSAPEIILLDVMMPGMDGYEVCRQLKASPETAHIPVVMLTALSETADRVRGLDAGADDFLTKPVDDFALMSRLNALLRYNAVTNELRQREASGVKIGAFSEDEASTLNRPVNVLVVDTSPYNIKRLRDPLEQAGHRVFTLDQADGLKQSGNEKLDVVLLGMSNQGYDPLRLCAHLRTNDATRALSIIVTVDERDVDLAGRALELGASDVIQQPLAVEELLARIRTQTRRSRYVEILRNRVDRGLELSVIDQLTGLYNRRYMNNQLSLWMKRSSMGGTPLSVVSVDIDHFKKVNDVYGHEAGDRVLKEFAERIMANVRPKDIVCRPGGEEFLVIMPETGGDLACSAAERIRRAIAAETFDGGTRSASALEVTVSAGVATFLGDEDTIADMMRRADDALYKAKSAGRNQVKSLAA
ncbi:PleD family two-component system response regulator [Henriciella algicola]|jgi:two-component system, cell cycle response regulator|uniref:diguanylate cyclase n=1 Tax=Henriciella algicola TaxID=1608422 RepID=A0A399RDI3_9PROT|nr:PleD family two-component system response regulator [Henriciella algicola]RIJ28733.1 PleD family two-component system response regulator [Henriciella algicola]